MNKLKLSIVVPCYNEAENIPLILERFQTVIKGNNIEVILVNNGSTDATDEILQSLLPGYPFAKSVVVPVNQGYGYGIVQGLKQADGDYIGWTHADMQTDPKDVIRAYRLILKKADERLYVKGTRRGRPWSDRFFTWGMSVFESIYFGMPLRDINAQPNIFPGDFFETWENPPSDFSLDLYAVYTAARSGLRIVRFPVLFPKRIHGKSKWNTGIVSKYRFIRRTLEYSKNLKHSLKEL